MVVRLVWEEPGLGFDSTRYGSTEAVMEATIVAICQLRGSHPYRLVNVAPPLASLPPSYRDAGAAAGPGPLHSGPLLLDPVTGRVIAALREPPPLMQQLSCQQPREDYPASSEPPTAAAADTVVEPIRRVEGVEGPVGAAASCGRVGDVFEAGGGRFESVEEVVNAGC